MYRGAVSNPGMMPSEERQFTTFANNQSLKKRLFWVILGFFFALLIEICFLPQIPIFREVYRLRTILRDVYKVLP